MSDIPNITKTHMPRSRLLTLTENTCFAGISGHNYLDPFELPPNF